MTDKIVPNSFRDPSGFLFFREGSLYRQVNRVYKEDFDHLIQSGLYKKLTGCGLLIPHEEIQLKDNIFANTYKILKPELIQFLSYPYEWSFSQLKDAALTTLKIQKIALEFGMLLKDSSAYNIQFKMGRPIFIDTLSFEKYIEGEPWVAYKQFCQHFLAPLSLMSLKDIRLNQLLKGYIDGIPLDLASSLLPIQTFLNFSLLVHIHSQAKFQRKLSNSSSTKKPKQKLGLHSLLALVDSLQSAVKKMKWAPKGTEWAEYYAESNHLRESKDQKKEVLIKFLNKLNPKKVWDFGANTGVYSRIVSDRGIQTISFDLDYACVEKNYLHVVKKNEKNILPLLFDLVNPSPKIGWQSEESLSLIERGPVDTVLALALIHHLAISNNLPLSKIADFFEKICNSIVIEFIPKSDPMVQKMISFRKDIFDNYRKDNFEKEFSRFFVILEAERIKGSERTIYLMKKK